MTWNSWIEQRRKLLVGGISMVSFLALAVTARRNPVSADSFWHLQMGTDWVVNGLSPWRDHYSFTFEGSPITSPPILFQVLLHWFVSRFGLEYGYELLRFVCYSLTLGLGIAYLRQLRAQGIVYGIVLLMITALVELRPLVRPELLSYSFSIVGLMLYRSAESQVTARTMLPIVLLMWLWSVYHSPVVGYVIFFGFFIDAAVRQLEEGASYRAWLKLLAWGSLVVAVGAFRPGLTHPVLNTLLFDSEWKYFIQEYQSPLLYKEVAAIYALIVLSVVTFYLSVRQRRFGYVAIILVLLYAASTMARMVTPSGIAIACLFAHVMSESDFPSSLRRSSPSVQRTAGAIALALILAPLWTAVHLAREYMEENRRSDVLFPSDVVQYMKQNDRSGNIFNEYRIGGYLIHSLSPDSKVYIDGRTNTLYPLEHYKQLLRAERSPEVFSEEVAKYDISLAIVQGTPENYFLMNEVGFGLDFAGAAYSLFVRNEPNFPVLGKLLGRPACWDEQLVEDLEAEEIRAALLLLPSSGLWPFLRLVSGYSQAADPTQYIGNLDSVEGWSDSGLRFAAYRALSHGSNALAINLLNAVRKREIKDPLAAAWGMIRLGDLNNAEKNLRVASETVWPYLELADLAIMNGLFQQLEAERPLSMISDGYLRYLEDQITDADIAGTQYDVTLELFCANDGWEVEL